MNLFSLISLFSYFAFFAMGYPLPVKAAYLKYGGRPQSQPTRCGHTLTRCPLPGLAGACRPSTPHKSQSTAQDEKNIRMLHEETCGRLFTALSILTGQGSLPMICITTPTYSAKLPPLARQLY